MFLAGAVIASLASCNTKDDNGDAPTFVGNYTVNILATNGDTTLAQLTNTPLTIVADGESLKLSADFDAADTIMVSITNLVLKKIASVSLKNDTLQGSFSIAEQNKVCTLLSDTTILAACAVVGNELETPSTPAAHAKLIATKNSKSIMMSVTVKDVFAKDVAVMVVGNSALIQ